ncbi:hypothetical protein KM043_015387 [Ampulex compressa]|nr:hypothetical protein KM043_015387 [Ampulex compressa]
MARRGHFHETTGRKSGPQIGFQTGPSYEESRDQLGRESEREERASKSDAEGAGGSGERVNRGEGQKTSHRG